MTTRNSGLSITLNPHMDILFYIRIYLVIRGKSTPRVISGSITDRNKIPRGYPYFRGGTTHWYYCLLHSTYVRGVQKFKMAACKPEVLIYRLVGVSISSTRWYISTSGLQAAILNFWTLLMSSKMDDSTIITIVLLSVIGAEISNLY